MSPKEAVTIVNTDQIDGDQLIVDFSDKTTAIYTSQQLAALTPKYVVHEDEAADE
jgi:hypothetical protein